MKRTSSARSGSYVVISPAKDEEQFIQRTVSSMLAQSVLPLKWIIVDDHSRDNTLQIIQAYSRENEWIAALDNSTVESSGNTSHSVPECRGSRAASMAMAAEIRAFNFGYQTIRHLDFEFIVKLDTDVELPPDYFERLLDCFAQDPTLGIACGGHVEYDGKDWQLVRLPEYHAAGACKVVRRRCFEEIGGFVSAAGWDTVDEIMAQARGWRTCHFPEIRFRHLRREGLAGGLLRTSMRHGQTYYTCGGSFLFFLAKFVHRTICGKPLVLGGIFLLIGYLRAAMVRTPRLVNAAEGRYYRRLLNRRIVMRMNRMLGLSRAG